MEKTYVHALIELLESGSNINDLLVKLRQVMVARGHAKVLPNVLRNLTRALQEKSVSGRPVVTVASSADETALASEIKAALHTLGADGVAHTVAIDDTLIGGLIATYNHRQIDQSYRTKLHTLYKSTVTT